MICLAMVVSTARSCWQLGSLSHFINAEASGYIPLPDYPTEAPDPSVRDVEVYYTYICTLIAIRCIDGNIFFSFIFKFVLSLM